MKVYIAGPMRGIEQFNWPAFDECEQRLITLCHQVINPAQMDRDAGLKPDSEVSTTYLRAALASDVRELSLCDAIAMLPGWERSEGAKIEHAIARMMGLVVLDHNGEFYDDNILDEAKRLTTGERNETYGHPLDDYTTTAGMWTAALGHEVTAEQAILCMMLVKISRLSRNITHRDSVVDVAGYANCLDMANQKRGATTERR